MYSGSTLTPLSGRILGAHQKIDRLARRSLAPLLPTHGFPGIRLILHFEGSKGPDAIKRKSPAVDEPWHYYSPFNPEDTALLDIIGGHYDQLVTALKAKDDIRAGFEAAWLAHAIVDGLTPAHHYPYEEKLTELRGGEGIETRTTIKGKLLMPGETRSQQIKNNWNMWGAKGLISTHMGFELGIALVLAAFSARPRKLSLTKSEIQELQEYGVIELFRRKAKEISALGMYDSYQKYGWTPSLARQTRSKLVPAIVHMVALAWYGSALDADIAK